MKPSPDPRRIITIRTKEGFIYKGMAIIYEDWAKHIFRDYEVVED